MTSIETNPQWDVAIIGGGAAGFFSAITIKEKRPELKVTLIESSRSTLAKVRISGGGRCNVTHACWEPKDLLAHYPRGHRKLQGNFQRFGPKEIVHWFENRGIPLKTEEDGRIFPVSDSSESISQCLEQEAQRLGVHVQLGLPLKEVSQDLKEGFKLTLGRFGNSNDLNIQNTQALILATGGAPSGYKLLNSLGHEPIQPKPSLFTFCVDDKALTHLSGVSAPDVIGKLNLPGLKKPITQRGPLLITHWGLSGPCILKLSAWGARELADVEYETSLTLDWFPESSEENLRQSLRELKKAHEHKQLKNCPSVLPQRLWHYLLEQAGFDLEQLTGEIKDKALNIFSDKLKRWDIPITGKGPFKEEFVTAGGVPLGEITLKSYESKTCPNLYVVGELLNIDGVTGGFNFQNAWTSGYLAGVAVVEKQQEERWQEEKLETETEQPVK